MQSQAAAAAKIYINKQPPPDVNDESVTPNIRIDINSYEIRDFCYSFLPLSYKTKISR